MLQFCRRSLQGIEAATLLGLLVLTGALWTVIAIAGKVVEGGTDAFDQRILLALRNPSDPTDPLGPGWFEEAVRDVTALGSDAVLLLLTMAVLGFLLLHRQLKLAGLLVVAVAGARVLSDLLKDVFDRTRPDLVSHEALTYSESFPSGHAMLSTAVYLTLAALLDRAIRRRDAKAYVLATACMLAFLVGLSRLYLGVHYPTDIVAGWALGLVWATVFWMIALGMRAREKKQAERDLLGDTSRPPQEGVQG